MGQLQPIARLLPILALSLAASIPRPTPPRLGEVILVSGSGQACPDRYLGADAVALVFGGAEPPAGLSPGATRFEIGGEASPLDRSQLSLVRHARAVHLVGGEGLGWWRALFTRGKRNALQHALIDAQARGAALVGFGTGAEYLCANWLAPAGALEAAGFRTRNPRRPGAKTDAEVLIAGLGLAPGGLLVRGDQALARALEVIHGQRAAAALILLGEIAWRYDPTTREVSLVGDGQALRIDARKARRGRSTLRELRVSLLAAGDRWTVKGEVLLAQPLSAPLTGPMGRAKLAVVDLAGLLAWNEARPDQPSRPRLVLDLALATQVSARSFAQVPGFAGHLSRIRTGVR
jgi:hypothetical protein